MKITIDLEKENIKFILDNNINLNELIKNKIEEFNSNIIIEEEDDELNDWLGF